MTTMSLLERQRIERAILRWCRVRGHRCLSCYVAVWSGPPAKLRAFVSVRRRDFDDPDCPDPIWLVRVEAVGVLDVGTDRTIVLHTPGTYAQAWALGADLARALERRGADGRRS